ncbi:MAG: DUF5060 domain-containing protein [Bacteroidota bacterium]
MFIPLSTISLFCLTLVTFSLRHFRTKAATSLLAAAALMLASVQVAHSQEPAFIEKDGLIVIQAESVDLTSNWVIESSEANHTGAGYIRWNGNDLFGNPGVGILAYRVHIKNAGDYNVRFRMSHLGAPKGDQENDVWARMNAGTWVKVLHPANYKDDGFTFNSPTEPSSGVFSQMRYTLSAGIHTFYISGRSRNARVDRIHMYKDGVGNPLNLALAESEFAVEDEPEEEPVEPPEITVSIEGALKKWHPVTLTLDGPDASEMDEGNPFLDYRFDVTFTQGDRSFRVPGYFAADGDAAESSAHSGNKWRAHFMPDSTGSWAYEIAFVAGANIAVAEQLETGTPTIHDGYSGTFEIADTDKTGRDHRGKGILRYVDKHYLQFDNGEYFLKGGANSPENFLAYADFDSTYSVKEIHPIKQYAAHEGDWTADDPTWQDGKGKGIIGALNYLSDAGMNAVYFLTMNVNGDGQDVWPWTAHTERTRFDVSKLDQWNVVFDHMDRKGLMLHVVLQETENELLLDGGNLGTQRKLYFRELVARFGHHHALTWNLGEENDENSDAQRKAFADYIRNLDVYNHPITIHTFPGQYDDVYEPLLGFKNFDGPSLQLHGMENTYSETLTWYEASAASGRPWVVTVDEFGPFQVGVTEEGLDSNHDAVRQLSLWPNLMAGGAGVEWYFGYETASHDLNNEDWRSRGTMWDYTRHALDFFQQHLPFSAMQPTANLTSKDTAYVFADSGKVYALYLPSADSVRITLPAGEYAAQWYNPRTGGELLSGEQTFVYGPGQTSLGQPPADPTSDWALLLTNTGAEVTYPVLAVTPEPVDFGAVTPDSLFSVAVDFSNAGTAPLVIDSLSLDGVHAAFFSLPPLSALDIDPGALQSIALSLAPDSTLSDSVLATLNVYSNDPVNPVYRVPVSGYVGPYNVPLDSTTVINFTLIDADTNEALGVLRNGMTLDLSTLPPHVNVRADVGVFEEDIVQYVWLELAPIEIKRRESVAPYALFGDLGGNFLPGTFDTGENTLVATPYIQDATGSIAGKSLTVSFLVVGINNKTSVQIQAGTTEEEIANRDDPNVIPDAFELGSNYPNPFNPTTTIPFRIPELDAVKLVVYDMLGREISTLIDETMTAGQHEVRFDASGLPSGTYLYKLTTPQRSLTSKMLLVK